MKIDTKEKLKVALAPALETSRELHALMDEASRRYGALDNNNFYLYRDFIRMNWKGATGVLLDASNVWFPPATGGNINHFLHASTSGDGRVAYTKNAAKGMADIQTVTTLSKYTGKYGIQSVNPDAFVPTVADVDKSVEASEAAGTPTPKDGEGASSTFRKVADMIDEMNNRRARASDELIVQAIADAMATLRSVMDRMD